MKTLHFDNKKSFLEELDGKVYAVCDHEGHYLCDILEESYIELTDSGVLVDKTENIDFRAIDAESDVLFRSDVGKQCYEEFKEKHGVVIEIDNPLDKSIEYVRKNVDMNEVKATIKRMKERREPLYRANKNLCDNIYDLMEEYSENNDLPEGWWMNYDDEESVMFKL